jgi:hypothetical protein
MHAKRFVDGRCDPAEGIIVEGFGAHFESAHAF